MEKLVREKTFIDTAIDSLPGIFYLLDKEGRLLRWNKNLERLSGYPGKKLARVHGLTLVDPADHQRIRNAVRRVFREGESTLEATLLTRDGQRIPHYFSGKRITMAGKPCMVGMGIDISKRKEAERALRGTELRFSKLFEHSSDGICLIDREGRILFQSPSSSRVLGHPEYKQGHLINLERIHPQDLPEVLQLFQHLLTRPSAHLQGEFRYRQDNGSWRWLEAIGTNLLHEPEVQAIVANYRDISERKQAEEILLRTQKMESLGLMAGGIAHDFNNLLAAMLGQTALVLAMTREDDPIRPHLQKAMTAAERAASLTQQLLAYAGHGPTAREPLNLNSLLEESRHLFEVVVPPHVRLDVKQQPALPLIQGNLNQLQQVLMNLILNSVQAIGDRPGTVSVSTSEYLQQEGKLQPAFYTGETLAPGRYIVLRVEDNGQGMPAGILPNIFDPFFTTREEGHGLGLAAVLGIVQGHRAHIQVESISGRGTTFLLYFPAVEQEARSTSAHRNGRCLQKGVLIIDDEEPVRNTVADLLKLDGIRVYTAASGQEGIDCYRQRRDEIGLVLLDQTMPGRSGTETLAELHCLDPDVRVILSCGDGRRCGPRPETGVLGFLPKPFTREELRRIIHEFGE